MNRIWDILRSLNKNQQDMNDLRNRVLKLEQILDGGVSLGLYNSTQGKVITVTLTGNPSTFTFSS
jgi:hypothetical protein